MRMPKELAIEHWKENQPSKYQKYLEAGTLEKEGAIVQAKVANMISDLTDEEYGLSWEEARQRAYSELIFTPPEQSVIEKQEAEDEAELKERYG